ncbi:MAG: hypothetical protein ACM3UR_02160 [Bacteroidota bacterium]|jgi:hypothetical protein|nr:hypothetical protein [Ignavibacteria bacterium]HEX2960891.1 hypothetical protein [Ignavibacteriales bacterium]
MDPHKIAVVSFLIIGIITFVTGMFTHADEEAFEEYNRVRTGIPPRVQKIKLIGIGSMWVIAGVLMLLEII